MALDSGTGPDTGRHARTKIDFATLIDVANEFVVIANPDGLLQYANLAWRTALGYNDDSIDSVLLLDTVRPDHRQSVSDVMHAVLQSGAVLQFTTVFTTCNGISIPVIGRMDCQSAHGNPTFLRTIMREVSAGEDAETVLHNLQAQFDSVFESPAIGMAIQDLNGRWRLVNDALAKMIGYQPSDLVKMTFRDITHPDDLDANLDKLQRLLDGTHERFQMEKRYIHRNGSTVSVILTVSAVRNRARKLVRFVSQVQDVTERKQLETQLLYKASHDVLTGLPNRALFMDRVEHALARIQRSGGQIAVMFLDLDGFKAINDLYGHEQGDRLLVEIGRRLRTCARAGDTVARLGGDEFTILLEQVSHPSIAMEVAQRVRETLRYPIMLGEHVTTISPSIGIAISFERDDRADAMLHDADIAMYAAKRAGKDRAIVAKRRNGEHDSYPL